MGEAKRISDEMFYSKADAMNSRNEESIVTSKIFSLNGFLVEINGLVAVVNEEYDGVRRLPTFIQTPEAAKSYIKQLDKAHQEGFEDGQEAIRKSFKKLLNL